MTPPPPPEPLLHLVFHGECLEGHDPLAVRLAVGTALKLDPAHAARLFSGRRVVMRRDVSPARAQSHIARFAAMGARMRVESAGSASAPATATATATASTLATTPAAWPASGAPVLRAPSAPLPMASSKPGPPVPGLGRDDAAAISAIGSGLRLAAVGLVVLTLGVVLAWSMGSMSAAPSEARATAPPLQAVAAAPGPVSVEAALQPAAPAASAPVPAPPATADAADDGPPQDMSAQARQEHRTRYLAAQQHRAFAIASGGVFGWIGGMPSEAEARERAVDQCMARLPAGGGSCRVVHADTAWLE